MVPCEKYKVVITARSFGMSDTRAEKLLEEHRCKIVRLRAGEQTIEEQLRKEIVDADALIAGLEVIDRAMIRSARKLKVISRYGVGYDQVDVKAAAEAGIYVTITPGANGDSVADLAVALMLNTARNVSTMDAAMKAENQMRPQGIELWQKTVGIIGAGRIGQGVARRCRGFDMRILCCDICENEEFQKECDVVYTDLQTILRESDFITLHSPLTDATKNLIGTKEFQMMKKDAILINTARGGIVDEAALYQALKNGVIRGAALDATVMEPPYGNPLLTLQNCIITPHAGSATKESSSKMSYMAAENVIAVLQDQYCKYAV